MRLSITVWLAGLLFFVSNSALAAWVSVGSTSIFTAYADPATIQKYGSVVKMWDTFNFYSPQSAYGVQFRSIMNQKEFDCNKRASRVVFVRFFSLAMGDGLVVSTSNEPREWIPAAPESIDELLLKFACKK